MENAHLDSTRVRFDVDHVSNNDLLLQDRLVDTWIQSKLFRALDSFETYDDMRHGFAVSTQRVFGFSWCKLRHFSLVDFFRLFYTKT